MYGKAFQNPRGSLKPFKVFRAKRVYCKVGGGGKEMGKEEVREGSKERKKRGRGREAVEGRRKGGRDFFAEGEVEERER